MEITDYIFWITWFAAGFVTGISGMGGAMIAVPILVTFMPTDILFPVTCIVTTLFTAYMAWIYRKSSHSQIVKRLFIGAIPGAVAGLGLLLYIKAQYIQLIAGIVMISFVYLQFLRNKQDIIQREETLGKTLLIGFGSGVLIASISFGGPLLGAYALYLGWGQAQAMGIMNVFALMAFVMATIFQASAGLYTAEVLSLATSGAIASIIGVICATPLVKHIPLKTFKLILLIIIGFGALSCIWRGLGL